MPAVIRHEGIFDHEALYKATKDFADAYSYKYTEKDFTKRHSPDGGEYKIKFTLKKNVDDYTRYTLEIEIWVWKGVEIIIEENGKQVKRTKGAVDIIVDPKYEKEYDCIEPSYREVQRGKKKTIFWDCATEKKYNDYIKNHIDVSFEVRDAEEVKAKKKNTYQCSLKEKVKGYIEKDYEERWHWNPFVFFIREVMDRFGNRNAMDRCGNEIKDESRNLINDLKAYLNVQVQ